MIVHDVNLLNDKICKNDHLLVVVVSTGGRNVEQVVSWMVPVLSIKKEHKGPTSTFRINAYKPLLFPKFGAELRKNY